MAAPEAPTAPAPEAAPKKRGRPPKLKPQAFVFIGDPNAPKTSPETITAYGCTFALDGDAVEVSAEHVDKLDGNSHFKRG
ncbi:MAG: hypothetical protein MJH10_10310 [Epibacterium sp.]|nr:hypothetical protein [Epibacterium sp.]NQX73932.1 hypothetical protein [Epibacterium sp.]